MITQLETELDTLTEGVHGLQSGVHVRDVLGLQVAGLVIDVRLDHTISNGLCHNEFGVHRRVQVQLLGNVLQRDLRVRQADHLHACLDHIVSQSLQIFEHLYCIILKLKSS